MRIMTFNLRFDTERNGKNSWCHRKKLVTQIIERYQPAVLGTQEGLWSQLLYLKVHLPGYGIHTPNRTVDDISQYPTLFFHDIAFDVLEGGEFWLSKTPEIHLSRDWDSAFPRMMSYAKLKDTDTGKVLWVAVTHLDNVGVEARYEQTKIIVDWVQKKNDPVILMGDFNDRPASPIHLLLTSPETGLQDTWQLLGNKEDSSSYTHHGFLGIPQMGRLDWILVSSHFAVKDAQIIRDKFDDRFPSDHYPYAVDLEWS